MSHIEQPLHAERRAGVLATVALLAIAYVLYRPFEPRPFDYVDFPEHVVLFRSLEGFGDRFMALVRVYLEHGRWSPITLAAVAAQWTVFEWWTPGWQIVRFALMSVVVILVQQLSRRLGLTETGAFVTALLFVVSPAVVPGWIRLSTPEPLGMPFLLTACHLALQKPTARTSIAYAVMLLAVMWTKEIMAAAFALPILLFLLAGENGLQKPRWTWTRVRWLLPSAIAFVVGAIPVIWAWRSAPPGSFASRYAGNAIGVGDLIGGSVAAWLPFAPMSDGSVVAVAVVLAAFLVIVLAGWRMALRPRETRNHRLLLLALGLAIPVFGAMIYSPWPFYLLRYAMPFAVAGSLVIGQASSSLFTGGRPDRTVGTACLGIVLTFSVAQAANDVSKTRALHQVFSESVVHVARIPGIDSVLVEVAPTQYESTGNFGPRFRTYASMLGIEWPAVKDVRCGETPQVRDRVLTLRVNVMCPSGAIAESAIVERYHRFDWPHPLPRTDSVAVSLGGISR